MSDSPLADALRRRRIRTEPNEAVRRMRLAAQRYSDLVNEIGIDEQQHFIHVGAGVVDENVQILVDGWRLYVRTLKALERPDDPDVELTFA